ncbi:MAG: SDR family oxidoreductase [Oscillospiraceae bacterium]|nr:SDR family oxidoreductase [Oscillospiraceae bacterium]
MDRLKGKVSIVTGASSGIGRRTAEVFAQEGSDLALVARRLHRLKEVEAECTAMGVRAISISADISVYENCQRVVQETIAAFGRVDVLVNDAGIADKHRPVTRIENDWWDHVIAVDQNSVYYMMKEVLPYMEKAGSGSIVNISSIGGVDGIAGISYSAAKAAVIAMTKNVGIQYAGTGIRCNSVAPGPTPTELNTPEQIATFDSEFSAKCHRHFDASVPEVTVDDQANAILFFASDDSKGCNGQTLVVDNGCTI